LIALAVYAEVPVERLRWMIYPTRRSTRIEDALADLRAADGSPLRELQAELHAGRPRPFLRLELEQVGVHLATGPLLQLGGRVA